MHEELGPVYRQRFPALRVLFSNHPEDLLQLLQRSLARVHERIASADGWNLGDPSAVLLRVQDDLVVGQAGFTHHQANSNSTHGGRNWADRRDGRAGDTLRSHLSLQGGSPDRTPLRSAEHRLPFLDRLDDLDVDDSERVNLDRVVREDDEVRQLADLDRAFGLLLEVLVSGLQSDRLQSHDGADAVFGADHLPAAARHAVDR